ncbi:MAG: hypothetical protein Q8P31_03835 [Bacillota bacterium]|nr:hypothetical protein [Bacillota bacterium]
MPRSASCMYTCGIIVESLQDRDILRSLAPHLVRERVAEMPGEPEGVWHIREYGIPEDALEQVLAALEGAVKHEWYSHLFNLELGILYVVFAGKHFRLPAVRDDSWEAMISYGLTVGVDRKWTGSIPLRV